MNASVQNIVSVFGGYQATSVVAKVAILPDIAPHLDNHVRFRPEPPAHLGEAASKATNERSLVMQECGIVLLL